MNWQQTKSWGKWVLPLGLALALTACGSNDNNNSEASATASASPSASSSASPSASPSASASAAAAPTAPEGSLTYENSEFGLTLQYPQDWTLQEDTLGVKAIFLSPTTAGDSFAENITYVAQSMGGEQVTLEQFGTMLPDQLKASITSFALVSNETTKVGDYDVQKLVYTGVQGESELKWAQFIAIENDTLYILTFTADIDGFDAAFPQAESIIGTMQIK